MISLSGIPFLRFTIAFVSGIFFYIFLDPSSNFLIITLGSFVIYLLLFLIQKWKRESFYFLRPIIGLSAILTLWLCGILTCQLSDERNHPNHLLQIKNKINAYTVLITSIPEEREKTYKVEAELRNYSNGQKNFPVKGKLILYISKSNYSSITFGDVLIIDGYPETIKPPLNPYEFNYQNYLKFHHIYHTHFVNRGTYKKIGSDEGNSLVQFAYQLRSKANDVICKFIPGKEEQGIASALLLGLKGTIDDHLKTVYSQTGTTHVLAVSGMHVLILFQFLLLLIGFASSAKIQKIVLPIVTLLLLALYVMITGFSPSVLRAAIMFGMIIIGKAIGRNLNIYNSMFFSAFCLLTYDPYMIMDTGFQLSYLALLGIVYFSNKIDAIIDVSNSALNSIWKMTSVSIAAQITTLPLTVYYFNQIPLSFLISNLGAIFLSNILLYSGFVLLTFSFVSPIAFLIGYFMKYLIIGMNFFLILIHKIPYATLSGIHLTAFETLLIYIIIVLITLFFYTKRFFYFFLLFVSLGFLITLFTIQTIKQNDQKKLVVFNIKGHYAVAFIEGQKALVVSDSTLGNEKFNRSILPMLTQLGIEDVSFNNVVDWLPAHHHNEYDLYCFNTKIIVLTSKRFNSNKTLTTADFHIIHPDNIPLLPSGTTKQVIILPLGKTKRTKELSSFYDLREKAAFVYDFN
jgi:competence protein ComEC